MHRGTRQRSPQEAARTWPAVAAPTVVVGPGDRQTCPDDLGRVGEPGSLFCDTMPAARKRAARGSDLSAPRHTGADRTEYQEHDDRREFVSIPRRFRFKMAPNLGIRCRPRADVSNSAQTVIARRVHPVRS
jgi:hypothetical protein